MIKSQLGDIKSQLKDIKSFLGDTWVLIRIYGNCLTNLKWSLDASTISEQLSIIIHHA